MSGPAGSTVAAVIGDPVRHSRSPRIHNAAFVETGLDWVYMAFEVAAGDAAGALDAMRVLRLGGMSVTMPHKAAVAAAADISSEAVTMLGAANCVVPQPDGRLRAENTDIAGFIGGLDDDAGISPAGRSVAVLGAGGAGRAVVHACHRAGASEIVVINRSRERAEVAAALAAPVSRIGVIDDVASVDLVVNATSVGMQSSDELPCPTHLIRPGQVAVDLIYAPVETEWLSRLRTSGVEGHNGLSMLVWQAAAAFELWTGVTAPVEAMRKAAAAD